METKNKRGNYWITLPSLVVAWHLMLRNLVAPFLWKVQLGSPNLLLSDNLNALKEEEHRFAGSVERSEQTLLAVLEEAGTRRKCEC